MTLDLKKKSRRRCIKAHRGLNENIFIISFYFRFKQAFSQVEKAIKEVIIKKGNLNVFKECLKIIYLIQKF